jgi:hypothetical protein
MAGLAGGVGMFLWASLAHMVLPLGAVGIAEITSNETALLDSMHQALGNSSGLYLFPSFGFNSAGSRSDAMKNYDAKLVTNPSGLLIYHPPGAKSLTPGLLVTEFLTELLEAILAVWLLAQTGITTLGGRIGFVAMAGVLASLPTNVSYWNWYGFPGSYTATYMAVQIAGFVVAGSVAAFVLRRRA